MLKGKVFQGFLYVSCFWFIAMFGLSVLALAECGMNSVLVRSILFYPITLEGRRGTIDDFTTVPFHLFLF